MQIYYNIPLEFGQVIFFKHKRMKKIETNETCCKKIKHSAREMGVIGYSHCTKKAEYTNGTHYFCKHHSKMGRFVIRDGEIGKVLARFDTEKELKENIHLYPGKVMQKLTKSHRRDIT